MALRRPTAVYRVADVEVDILADPASARADLDALRKDARLRRAALDASRVIDASAAPRGIGRYLGKIPREDTVGAPRARLEHEMFEGARTSRPRRRRAGPARSRSPSTTAAPSLPRASRARRP